MPLSPALPKGVRTPSTKTTSRRVRGMEAPVVREAGGGGRTGRPCRCYWPVTTASGPPAVRPDTRGPLTQAVGSGVLGDRRDDDGCRDVDLPGTGAVRRQGRRHPL